LISYTSDNEFFKEKTETFPVMRFFLELTQHIPPKGCQYIRRYGLYASRTKGKWPDKPHVVQLALRLVRTTAFSQPTIVRKIIKFKLLPLTGPHR
jgi:hypothetical protein